MDNIQKKPVNKILIVILALLVVGGCVFGFLKYKAHKEALEYLKIDFGTNLNAEGNIQLEYDLSKANALDLVSNHTGTIEVSQAEIDRSVTGESLITYTLSTIDSMGGSARKTVEKKVIVTDTQLPVIEFDSDKVSMTIGKAIPDNRIVVSDPVDGQLQLVETEPANIAETGQIYESGWYTVLDETDANTEGEYTVSITACDKNGNKAEKTYLVVVEKSKYTYKAKLYTVSDIWDDDTGDVIGEDRSWSSVTDANLLKLINDALKHPKRCLSIKNNKRSVYTSLDQIVEDGLFIEDEGGYGDVSFDYYVFVYDANGKTVKKHKCYIP